MSKIKTESYCAELDCKSINASIYTVDLKAQNIVTV